MIFEETPEREDQHEPDWKDYAGIFVEGFESWSRAMAGATSEENRLKVFVFACTEAVSYVGKGLAKPDAIDALFDMAHEHGLVESAGHAKIDEIIAKAFAPPAQPNGNGQQHPQESEDPGVGMAHGSTQSRSQARATPYIQPDAKDIPPRAWLHGGHYIRQAATATVAPGGFGKTTLTLFEAISMIFDGLRIWYLSGEDPRVEIDRRIAAHCKHHGIKLADATGQLFVDDKSTFAFFVGTSPRTAMVKFDDQSLQQFEEAIIADQIDVVLLDPFVSFHSVPENDNGAIDQVVKRLASIAYRTNCCLEISHHVRKSFQGQATITVDDARGGGAIINAVRSGRVINRMTAAEADQVLEARSEDNKEFMIDDRVFYFRVDKGKRNMAPPDKAEWYHMHNVHIDNEDWVQALSRWDFPKQPTANDADVLWLRTLMTSTPGRRFACDSRNKTEWLGIDLAQHFSRDREDEKDKKWIRRQLRIWVEAKILREVKRLNEDSKEREYYELVQTKGHDGKPDTGPAKRATANGITGARLFDEDYDPD